MYRFYQQLKNIKKKLKAWNKNIFEYILQGKQDLEQHMGEIQQHIILNCKSNSLSQEETNISQ